MEDFIDTFLFQEESLQLNTTEDNNLMAENLADEETRVPENTCFSGKEEQDKINEGSE